MLAVVGIIGREGRGEIVEDLAIQRIEGLRAIERDDAPDRAIAACIGAGERNLYLGFRRTGEDGVRVAVVMSRRWLVTPPLPGRPATRIS